MFSICQWPNHNYAPYLRGRNHLNILDFRISSKLLLYYTKDFYNNQYLATTALQMITRYMDYVTTPYLGYKLKAKYAKIISSNPVGGGRLFRDKNGRPADNVLAALYLGCGPYYQRAKDECEHLGRYPGKFNSTTMDAEYDPYFDE